MNRETCIVCGHVRVAQIVDLGMHAFADTFVPASSFYAPDIVYPLACGLCAHCGHVQAVCVTEPEERYQNPSRTYAYTSANSFTSRKHWDDFAAAAVARVGLQQGDFVVEAGSNDGYLLHAMQEKYGVIGQGVDPSHRMALFAAGNRVPTHIGFFEGCDAYLPGMTGATSLVIANNVLNHSNNPVSFIQTADSLLKEDGWFVCEMPYWGQTVSSGRFDQIYHEHVSYFTVSSLSCLLADAGMTIRHVEVVDYHGGSLRVFAQKGDDTMCSDPSALLAINTERAAGLLEVGTYHKWMDGIRARKDKFMTTVYRHREEGTPIVAVGAAAKGNTFLTYTGLNNRLVDFVTDASPEKQGKYTPLTRIPIMADEALTRYTGRLALVFLAWNIPEVVVANIKKNLDPKCTAITIAW